MSSGFFFGAKSCHCCQCEFCTHECLLLTFTGWGGPPSGCLCEDLDGEYLLQRVGCTCTYEWCGQKTCSNGVSNVDICLTITLAITATDRTLTVSTPDTTEPNFTGTIVATDSPCGDMEFAPGDITGITSPGTVTVTPGTCPDGERQPCCTDCCDVVVLTNTGSGSVPLYNEYQPSCCAYITCTVSGVDVAFPVGVYGTWLSKDPVVTGPLSITSTCEKAYYIDYTYLDGAPACHKHVTTAKRSIVMTISDAVVEVFLGDNCCPESIQVYNTGAPPVATGFALAFGPATIANAFKVGAEFYDLYICNDAPSGACCLPGDFYLGQRTEYECEAVGDGIDTGTWTQGGTGCP